MTHDQLLNAGTGTPPASPRHGRSAKRTGRGRLALLTIPLALLWLAPVRAAGPEKTKLWDMSLSLSYVATSGNSDTQTGGTDFVFKRKPDPWGITGKFSYMQARNTGETTAERTSGQVRGNRAFGKRWEAFVGVAGMSDRFSGIHRRYLVETGGTYNALIGPRQHLSFDAGLTQTREEYTDRTRRDFFGGLLGARYDWIFSKGSKFTQNLSYFPDFDMTTNWRFESETALQAAVNDHLALKAGVQVRYDNEPQPGFKKTDTTTTVSLVFRW